LADGQWELEIAINVVSTQQWTYVTLIMVLTNIPSWKQERVYKFIFRYRH
jgi:hypothetical protein